MTRDERILTLLEHLEDFLPALGTAVAGQGGVQLMPAMWHHPSVRELVRTLYQLRQADPLASANVHTYYRAEWKTTDTTKRIKTRKGYKNTPGPRTRIRILPSGYSTEAKNRGVKYILDIYQGEPFLPDELREELVSTG